MRPSESAPRVIAKYMSYRGLSGASFLKDPDTHGHADFNYAKTVRPQWVRPASQISALKYDSDR